MNQFLLNYLYLVLLVLLVLLLTPPFLFALFEIDETLSNGNATNWK